ncbi:MAG: DNA-packaging protein [Clostridiales bacterium]|nr:DNA-packaging protein [Clostridiales bacterium]
MALIDTCKKALRVTTTSYDDEITNYINAAKLDLGIAGVASDVVTTTTPDSLVTTAILTYVRMRFGAPDNYDKLKASYDEQKAQLQNATGYTVWGVNNE